MAMTDASTYWERRKAQITAAGFQLKGSGWYATDFKGGSSSSAAGGGASSGGHSCGTGCGCD